MSWIREVDFDYLWVGLLSVCGLFHRIAPLVVHKDLLAAKDPKVTTLYDETFKMALSIGGSYGTGTRVFVGGAPLGNTHAIDHYVTVQGDPVSVDLANPLYVPGGTIGLATLLGDADLVEDPIWPRDQESVTFTNTSFLEDTIANHRYESICGCPCPPAFLPSKTNHDCFH